MSNRRILGVGLTIILVVAGFCCMPALAQFEGSPCASTSPAGDLDAGDNFNVLPSLFTTIWCDHPGAVGSGFQDANTSRIAITKFRVNRNNPNAPGAAPLGDVTDVEVRLIDPGVGPLYQGVARVRVWPVPSSSFSPAFTPVTITDNGELQVEIRLRISDRPVGGDIDLFIELEGSEDGTGFTTGFVFDPPFATIDPAGTFALTSGTTPGPDNLNPLDAESIFTFTVSDPVDLNTQAITINIISLKAQGTFMAGCVATVEVPGLIPPQPAGGWPATGILRFNVPTGAPRRIVPDNGTSTFNVVVSLPGPSPMNVGCDFSTIGVDVDVNITENITIETPTTIPTSGASFPTATDPAYDTIRDAGFEIPAVPRPFTPVGPLVGPASSTIYASTFTVADSDRNNLGVTLDAVQIMNIAPLAAPPCRAPDDIASIVILDSNNNVIGTSTSFGRINLSDFGGTPGNPVAVVDNGTLTLQVQILTADWPPPAACTFTMAIKTVETEGSNLYDPGPYIAQPFELEGPASGPVGLLY